MDYSDTKPVEIQPFSADDVNAGVIGKAPPSYEEVMGQYETSVGKSVSLDHPTLAYIDIMPRMLHQGNMRGGVPPKFENYDDITKAANVWLADNGGLQVWKCETVERKLMLTKEGDVRVDLQSMQYKESTYGANYYVFGLRMWLCPRAPGQSLQKLGLVNGLPTQKEIDVLLHPSFCAFGSRRRRRLVGYPMYPTFGGLGCAAEKLITFEGLKKSLVDINKKFKEKPIPGTVLTVESTSLKLCEGFEATSLEEVANVASWFERKGISTKRLTQILRIFYVCGPSTTPEIKMQEFVPEMTACPEFMLRPPKFEDYNAVMERARSWLQQQSGIKIVNFETRYGKIVQFYQSVSVETDLTDDFHLGMLDERLLRFLRVFYVGDPAVPSMAQSFLTSKLFEPVVLTTSSREGMVETMGRVDAWVRAVGLPIVSLETCYYPKQGPMVDDRRCDCVLKTFGTKDWLATIRVYFASSYTEPDPSLLPPVPKRSSSSACNIL